MFPLETKILIADDVVGARELIKFQLSELGYKDFHEAEDGLSAFHKILTAFKLGKPFGLILADWHMPEMSGYELLAQVRADPRLEKVPFVMITTEDEMPHVIKAIRLGVSDYIVKPINPAALGKKLEAVWKKVYGGA